MISLAHESSASSLACIMHSQFFLDQPSYYYTPDGVPYQDQGQGRLQLRVPAPQDQESLQLMPPRCLMANLKAVSS